MKHWTRSVGHTLLATTAMMLCTTALAADAAPKAVTAEVFQSVRMDESRPLRDILAEAGPAPVVPVNSNPTEIPNIFPKSGQGGEVLPEVRAAAGLGVQRTPSGNPAPSTIVSFNGSNGAENGSIPPDTNGDVSPAHYIQWVNTTWSIFNKTTGARISGPNQGNSFWAGFGGPCQTRNNGDPIVLWDDQAQRWVMSQFITSSPFAQCFAISTTSDPLGTYYRYQFTLPQFGDYPHIGVWTDAEQTQDSYLLVTHDFILSPQQFLGAAFIAVERDKMLQGLPAQIVRFAGIDAFGALPVHLEGQEPVAAGSCPVFLHFDFSTSEYLLWDLCINWSAPTASTLSTNPARLQARTPFVSRFDDVSQLGTTSQLDSFGSNLMYRAS